MKLIIAEKPSLARSVAKVLGVVKNHSKSSGYIECKDDYVVTWVFGHILELVEPDVYDPSYKSWKIADLPIRPGVWKLEVKKDSKDQFKNIKELLKTATVVINCGDPDREGQLLIDELLIHLKVKKPTKRLLILDPKDAAIRKAIENMEDNSKYFSWYQAGLLRSQADWLIGMNFTRAFTLLHQYTGGEGVISSGRVQTPTLKLIYDRGLAISNFKPLNYYNLMATFCSQADKEFMAKLDFNGLKLNLDADGRLIDSQALVDISTKINKKTGVISKYEVKACETPPPLTFKLSELQSIANAKLGYSADETLSLAQSLYEKQLTTYPRSACSFLPESLHADATNILASLSTVFTNGELLKATPSIKSRAFNDKELGGESHFAITPTGDVRNMELVNDEEFALYKLIALQYLAQFYPNIKYEQTTGTVAIEGYNFNFSGRVTHSLGWKTLFSNDKDNSNDELAEVNDDEQTLPPLALNEIATHRSNDVKCTTTKKPKPYTEGNLIKVMANIHNELENIIKSYYADPVKVKEMVERYKKVLKDTAGLGTEATRSNIIKTLKTRGFIELNRKNIQITDKGKSFMQLLTSPQNIMNFSMLTSPLTTAIYEQQLDGVLNNRFTAEEFYANLDKLLNDKISSIKTIINAATPAKSQAKTTGEKCPECGSDIVERQGKFGMFEACSNYPKCEWIDKNSKTINPALIKTGEKCPKCAAEVVERDGKFGRFKACSNYPKCEWTPPKITLKPILAGMKCPKCGAEMHQKSGKKGIFFGCSKYPECKFILK